MSTANDQKKLEIYYDNQRDLLERFQLHQHNLNILLLQKAKYGLDVPLRLHNEIDQQKMEMNGIRKELKDIDLEIAKLTSPPRNPSSSETGTKPRINLNGVDYVIEIPFPFISM